MTAAAVTAAAPTPTAAAVPTAPKFLGALDVTEDLPKAGALEENAGLGVETTGAAAAALRLLDSSSSCCFFASACLSDQVSFFAPPADDGEGEGCELSCPRAAKGFFSFFGAGRLTGE